MANTDMQSHMASASSEDSHGFCLYLCAWNIFVYYISDLTVSFY